MPIRPGADSTVSMAGRHDRWPGTDLRRDPLLSPRPGWAASAARSPLTMRWETAGTTIVRITATRLIRGRAASFTNAGAALAEFLTGASRAGGLWSGSSPACQRQIIATNCDCAAASGGDRSPHRHFESSSSPVHLRAQAFVRPLFSQGGMPAARRAYYLGLQLL